MPCSWSECLLENMAQFLFPLYIYFIAGVIIVVCRYSSRLTKLIGDRAVPLLATLFLLSCTKLIRTVITIMEYGELTVYPEKSKIIVWYVDGNLSYCHHPHIYLFAVAVATLIFCLSFTLFLLLIQCWRRVSHLRLMRWINKFTPFYDAYFAPLKDKHHLFTGLQHCCSLEYHFWLHLQLLHPPSQSLACLFYCSLQQYSSFIIMSI